MQPIEPVTFARLMQLPSALRSDVLECASSTEISARQMERMIQSIQKQLEADGENAGPDKQALEHLKKAFEEIKQAREKLGAERKEI